MEAGERRGMGPRGCHPMDEKPLEGRPTDDHRGTGGDMPGEGRDPRGELEETRVVGGAAIAPGEADGAGAYAPTGHYPQGAFDAGAPSAPPHEARGEAHPGVSDAAAPVEEADPGSEKRRFRLRAPTAWGRWVAVIVPAALHINMAIQEAGARTEGLPAFHDIAGDLRGMLQAFISLFYNPETLGDTVRIYALWIFVLLGLSIYGAIRSGDGLPIGVLGFIGYCLATGIILLVIVPGVWFLVGDKSPLAVALAAPAALLGITSLLAAGAGSPD